MLAQSQPGALSTNPLTPPAPGQFWPEQAAWYAGPVARPDGMVIALLLPEGFDRFGRREWGQYGQEMAGADSLHDGATNTAAMAGAGSKLAADVIEHDAAWYLPSRIEALQLFAVLKDHVGEGIVWTSTQYSANDAWYQTFGDGGQSIYGKDNEFRAVAVRSLILNSLNASVEEATL